MAFEGSNHPGEHTGLDCPASVPDTRYLDLYHLFDHYDNVTLDHDQPTNDLLEIENNVICP